MEKRIDIASDDYFDQVCKNPFLFTEDVDIKMSEYILGSIAGNCPEKGWEGKEVHLGKMIELPEPVLNPWRGKTELPENMTEKDLLDVCDYRKQIVVYSEDPNCPEGTLFPLMDVDEESVAHAHELPNGVVCRTGARGMEEFFKKRNMDTSMFLYHIPLIGVYEESITEERKVILNDLANKYQNIIVRAERYRRLQFLECPPIVLWNEAHILQHKVWQLFEDEEHHSWMSFFHNLKEVAA